MTFVSFQSYGQSEPSQCKPQAQSFIDTVLNQPNSGQKYLRHVQNQPGEIAEALNQATNAAKKMYTLADQRLSITKTLKKKISDEVRVLDHLIDRYYTELLSARPFCNPDTADGKRVCKKFYSTEKKRLAETFGTSPKSLRFQSKVALNEYISRRKEFVAKLPELDAQIGREEMKKKQLAERIVSTINSHEICEQIYFNTVKFKFVPVTAEEKVESISLVDWVDQQTKTATPDLSAN